MLTQCGNKGDVFYVFTLRLWFSALTSAPPISSADMTADLRGQSWEVGSDDLVSQWKRETIDGGGSVTEVVKVTGLEMRVLDLIVRVKKPERPSCQSSVCCLAINSPSVYFQSLGFSHFVWVTGPPDPITYSTLWYIEHETKSEQNFCLSEQTVFPSGASKWNMGVAYMFCIKHVNFITSDVVCFLFSFFRKLVSLFRIH